MTCTHYSEDTTSHYCWLAVYPNIQVISKFTCQNIQYITYIYYKIVQEVHMTSHFSKNAHSHCMTVNSYCHHRIIYHSPEIQQKSETTSTAMHVTAHTLGICQHPGLLQAQTRQGLCPLGKATWIRLLSFIRNKLPQKCMCVQGCKLKKFAITTLYRPKY